jgi:hypothetical protein
MAQRTSLKALRNLIVQAETILSTTTLPERRTERALELLRAAVALTDDLLVTPPAAILGAEGGKATLANRGPDYFRQLAARRKTHGGGRPSKKKSA